REIPLCSGVTDDEAEALAKQFEERHGVTMTIGAVLTYDEYEPWLAGRQAGIVPYFWNRYRRLLTEKGFSGQVLAKTDEVTDRILGLLENPLKEGSWDRRGMVVGHVQSGKTANYTGLICKSADAGYKLIVVIAGIHNNLRNQTQRRIDEGFVGRDSTRMLSNRESPIIGVGNYDQTRRPVTFTNSVRDFNKTMATGVGVSLHNLNEPAVFVIKKNSSTLKNLIEWLREHSAKRGNSKVDSPMLLIDDEADNASINTRHGSGEVSRINGQIRELLDLFEKSSYVGYTATPFANIFIDPDSEHAMIGQDLFPRHFIVSLDPPTNYFGPSKVFQQPNSGILRPLEDNEETLPIRHPKETQVWALPESLKTAIRTFVLGRAIRVARRQGQKHCSMLVNASRFTEVQRQLRNEIHQLVQSIQASARLNASLPTKKALLDSELKALYDTWKNEFEKTTECDWQTVQKHLHEAVASVVVVEVNSRSSGALNYEDHEKDGMHVIAVGGYALSRGLTLEGLMVSYFLRNSIMYDTLMQMGRWFGYRPGYEDLCRIWMPEAAEGWYTHIAESIEELREELRNMEAANATPEQFGLKVRSHPDTLIVTARNKMGSGERLPVSIGLSKRFVETAILKWDSGSLVANRLAARHLAENLAKVRKSLIAAEKVSGGWLVSKAPVAPVDSFLAEFQNHKASMITETGPVRAYIEERKGSEMKEWDILFASLEEESPNGLVDDSLGRRINCQRRSSGEKSNAGVTLLITNKHRVASRGVEKIGLTNDQIAQAERMYRERKEIPAGAAPVNYSDRIYRPVRERPLLVVHLLAIGKENDNLSTQSPVVAWSISFPGTAMEEKLVEY